MDLFGRTRRSTDPLWKVASATPIFAADAETVTRLVTGCGRAENEPPVDGVLVARRHPTGWFVHAVRRDALPADRLRFFDELVTVRSYLLLTQGPQVPVWTLTPGGSWCSPAVASTSEFAALTGMFVESEGPSVP